MLDALTVLEGILEVCPIQGAIVMEKPLEANAKIHVSYKKLLEVLLGMRWSVERFMIKLEIKLLP